jgi:hypothetical protein
MGEAVSLMGAMMIRGRPAKEGGNQLDRGQYNNPRASWDVKKN